MADQASPLRVVGLGGGSEWSTIETVARELVPSNNVAVIAFAYNGWADSPLRDRVVLASGQVTLRPERIYVVPREHDAVIVDYELHVVPAQLPRTPVDRLFRSFATGVGAAAVAVVLGGDGADGTIGIGLVKESGGIVVVQAPDGTATDMQRSAVSAGVADLVLPLAEIGPRIARLVAEPPAAISAVDDQHAADALREILTVLRLRTGHDFRNYKRATLQRRLARRMQVCGAAAPADYLRTLHAHPAEITELLRDFLISVTNFFRDPDAFAAIARTVMPQLFTGKSEDDQVRIWVAGCATGEEAYTLAMLAAEHAHAMPAPPRIQIFATDIDEHALATARAGFYPDTIAADVSADRLARFFVRDGGGYRVAKHLRDGVLFSPHNVLRDPPFSRLDLISCRNLLIYLDREAQEQALGAFHFGLASHGVLMLGLSENADGLTTPPRFAALDAAQSIYRRRLVPAVIPFGIAGMPTVWQPANIAPRGPRSADAASGRTISFGAIHHRLVERYAGPSIVVNADLEVVHSSEGASAYLQWSAGEPTRELLRLVHPALRLDLRTAIYAAREPAAPPERRAVRFDDGGRVHAVELDVRALDLPDIAPGLLLVVFRALPDGEQLPVAAPVIRQPEPLIEQLELDLQRSRSQLRATVEQYESSLEELKASNEELHAINEELRSATEELETSKEELQSVNEELSTLNQELQLKIDEVSRAQSDVQNLITATDIGVVFLDRDLNIQRFTDRARDLVNVIASDVGRPLAHLTTRFDHIDLAGAAAEVLGTLRIIERDIRAHDGKRYLARLRPYRSIENRIEGVVLTFVEVTELKIAEESLRERDDMLQMAELAAGAGVWRLDSRTGTVTMSNQCAALHGVPAGTTARETWLTRLALADRERFDAALDRTIATAVDLDVEVAVNPRRLWIVGRAQGGNDRVKPSVAGIALDVTLRRRVETELRQGEARFRLAMAIAPIFITRQDRDHRYTWGFVGGEPIAFVGATDAEVFPADQAELLRALKQELITTGSNRHLELELTHAGTTRWFELHLSAITDDDGIGVMAVGLDITAAKQLEAELHEASRRKDLFLATLAHELRSPLAPISSALDMLQLAPPDDHEIQHEARAVMDRQLRHLVRLVDDLMDLARISRDRLELRLARIDVREVIAAAVESIQPALARAGHDLRVDRPVAPIWIDGDLSRLTQVLGNALSNAIKYTPAGGELALTVTERPTSVEVAVRDNGVGIAPDILPRVFDMFVQAGDTLERAQGGLGIGLNLVKRVVELHGGTVTLTSAGAGQGALLAIELPRVGGT